MVGLSCSGIECALFGAVLVLFVVVVGVLATPAGLAAAQLVR
jgi:hypothetical protein